jgi:septal ring factor EnvC (AmiA/AmiB activator)
MLSAGVTAQTSPSSTPTNPSPAASEPLTHEQTLARLIAEVKELRQLVETQRAERDALSAKLEAEQKYSTSLERSYGSAQREIDTLNRSIEHFEKAIALNEKTVALIEKQRDDAKRDAKRSRKQAAVATVVAVIGILKFIL